MTFIIVFKILKGGIQRENILIGRKEMVGQCG